MNKLKNPLQVIELLKETSGTNDKIEILKEVQQNEYLNKQFVELINYAYNPYINYYIKQLDEPEATGVNSIFDENSIKVIERIINRDITGHSALNELKVLQNSLTSNDQKLLQLILKRSFDCGISDKTINKVWADLVPTFNVMLCTPLNEKSLKKIKWPAVVQVKYDAARVAIIVENNNVTYYTRNGKLYNIENSTLDREVLKIANGRDLHLDGELFQGEGDRVTSNGVTTKFVRGTASREEHANVQIVLWDLVDLDNFKQGKDTTQYDERFADLTSAFEDNEFEHIKLAETKIMDTIEEAKEWSTSLIAQGLEGVIIKNIKSPWEGKRSGNLIKIKEEKDSDLKVVAIAEGNGKFEGMCGALQCESSDGLVKVSVGSGLNDEQRQNEFHPDNAENIVGKIITIKHNGIIKDRDGNHSLYLPRFIEVREDKDEADDINKIKDESS